MSNFIMTYKRGQAGGTLSLSTGLPGLNVAIGGIKQNTAIGVAASPKVGKTTFVDFAFLIMPYLYCLSIGILDKVCWIYFSFEIDRVGKEFKFAAFFFHYDYQVSSFNYDGQEYEMCAEYLMGRLIHKQVEGEPIEYVKVSAEHEVMIKAIYENRIEPMFGEYADDGVTRLKKGCIDFIDIPDNPTGLRAHVVRHAKENGKEVTTPYTIMENNVSVTKHKIIGYTPNDPEKFTIVITDHLRKLRLEQKFLIKQNVDKWLEYVTEMRKLYKFTFINIIHSNRNLANPDRLKTAGEWIFPTGDDSKDTGNIAEESTVFMTLFNPNDEKYSLDRHFGFDLKNYPNYRSLHITESRDTPCPTHLFYNMYGGINTFIPIQ